MACVLIVDDSPTEMHVLRKILEKNGYTVITASSGEEGIETARQSMPDLVLMDVVMPGLNGYQATRQLSKTAETESIPVIICTTKDQETDRLWGLRQGAMGYLTKPVSEGDLIVKIKEALAA